MQKNIDNKVCSIPLLGLGGWVFGGHLWGDTKEEDSINTIKAALDFNINFIDTAPVYGNGRSENVIGKAIRKNRGKYLIATKCGLVSQGKAITHNLTPQSIIYECEQSLLRLKTDYIDIYQCHWPDSNTPIEESIQALNRLKEQGKIRFIGFSNYALDQLEQIKNLCDYQFLQYSYSLLARDIEKNILKFSRENEYSLLTYGSLGGGILTGKYVKEPYFKKADVRKFFYQYYKGEIFNQITEFLTQLHKINKPLNQIAINWVRQQRGVSCVLLGCRTPFQLEQNAQALDWNLTEPQIHFIQNQIINL